MADRPKPFTNEYHAHVFNLIKDLNIPKLMPRAEIEYLKTFPMGRPTSDQELYCMLAFNRVANRICNKCGYKDDVYALRPCQQCHLTYYCSQRCMDSDQQRHALWCCRPDGPRDMGFLKTTMLKLGDSSPGSSSS